VQFRKESLDIINNWERKKEEWKKINKLLVDAAWHGSFPRLLTINNRKQRINSERTALLTVEPFLFIISFFLSCPVCNMWWLGVCTLSFRVCILWSSSSSSALYIHTWATHFSYFILKHKYDCGCNCAFHTKYLFFSQAQCDGRGLETLKTI
jgi:hypothetical protein